MTIPRQLQEVTRTSVRGLVSVTRVPLRAIELVAGRGGDDGHSRWSVVLTVDSIGANVKHLVGSATGDSVLEDEGRKEQEQIDEYRRAATLDRIASNVEEHADQRFEERRREDAKKRANASRQARRREQAVDADAQGAIEEIEEEASEAESELEEEAEIAGKSLAREERAARAASTTEERAAIQRQRRALQAERRASELERELDTARARRKKTS